MGWGRRIGGGGRRAGVLTGRAARGVVHEHGVEDSAIVGRVADPAEHPDQEAPALAAVVAQQRREQVREQHDLLLVELLENDRVAAALLEVDAGPTGNEEAHRTLAVLNRRSLQRHAVRCAAPELARERRCARLQEALKVSGEGQLGAVGFVRHKSGRRR